MLEFLPLYSPDFNLIEKSFSALKAWIRRNRQLIKGFKDFSDFLDLTVEEFIKGKNARGYFRSAKIEVNKEDKEEINILEND
jgi:transposase